MTHPQDNYEQDEPLSAEAEAVMAKARRRAGLSMLIMMLGFMTIAIVVVYRLSTMGSGIEQRYALEEVVIPAGAEVVSAQVQDGLVTVVYIFEGGQTLRIFDGKSGELVREIPVVER